MLPGPVAIIGNPQNRRVSLFQQALERRGCPRASVISYADLLTGRKSLLDVAPGAALRIDSPGEDYDVERLMLAAGEADAELEGAPAISAKRLANLPEDVGRILMPRQWYLGFCHCLREIQGGLDERRDIRSVSCPADIEVMFDKTLCHRVCDAEGVSVPAALGSVRDLDELVATMEAHHLSRVFVKLANSSSASGVVALHYRRGKFEATTTVEIETHGGQTRLYNSLHVRRYTNVEVVRSIIDALAPHRIHVEEWLPKAALDGCVFDLRIVAIGGEPRHWVVRTSRGPITNLHLGNRRGSVDELLDKLDWRQQQELAETCRRVARIFAKSMQMGIDVLLTPNYRRHAVLEANAFGDLLPNVLWNGLDTYEAQVAAMSQWCAEVNAHRLRY
jgi:hypothetical protein